jgi:hypothetical protein
MERKGRTPHSSLFASPLSILQKASSGRAESGFDVQREWVRAEQERRAADAAQVEELIRTGQTGWHRDQAGWEKPAGPSLTAQDAADRKQAERAERERQAGRAARWREHVRAHPYPFDMWGNPKQDHPYDRNVVPDWWEYGQ